MSYRNNTSSTVPAILGGLLIAFVVFGGIGGCMYTYPKYNVYSQRMAGQAEFQRAEANRRIAVSEAEARKDSAMADADAERIRAQGAADANAIVSDSLGGPEGYLRYLAVEAMRKQAESPNTTVIYVATEGNIPVTEAQRFNKPVARTE